MIVVVASGQTLTSVDLALGDDTLITGQTTGITCTNHYSNGSMTVTCATINNFGVDSPATGRISGTTLTAVSPGSTHIIGNWTGGQSTADFSVGPPATEYLGVVEAPGVIDGLGWNVQQANTWEFATAAAAHATRVRFQCGWESVEIQSAAPANTSGGYSLPSGCTNGIAAAVTHGIKPTVLAAYGPPYHEILRFTVPAGASMGATSLAIVFASGVNGSVFSNIQALYDTIIHTNGNRMTTKGSYAGGLIIGVSLSDATHATITLASGLSSSLPANSNQYVIRELLYPPPLTFAANNSSVLAYTAYAKFLAGEISAAGLTGEVELWNEPPWADDPWDVRGRFYDIWPGNQTPGPTNSSVGANYGFVSAIQADTDPIANVTYTWAGTNITGSNSVLANMPGQTGVAYTQPGNIVSKESFHPYGSHPELHIWTNSCMVAAVEAYSGYNFVNDFACNLFGVAGGNQAAAINRTYAVKYASGPAYGVAHDITETGMQSSSGTQLQRARYIMRQFLSYQAQGVTPIHFYRLYDSPQEWGFGTYDGSVFTPDQCYTALQGFMEDLQSLKNPPVASYPDNTLPQIQSYEEMSYPLDSMHIVGSGEGSGANSSMLIVWQRTYSNAATNTAEWAAIPSPSPGTVTVSIPPRLRISGVVNLDTRDSVDYSSGDGVISLMVSDDPIEILTDPIAGGSIGGMSRIGGNSRF